MAAALRWMSAARRTRVWRADATHGSGGAEADDAQRVDAEASPSLVRPTQAGEPRSAQNAGRMEALKKIKLFKRKRGEEYVVLIAEETRQNGMDEEEEEEYSQARSDGKEMKEPSIS
uniref:Uncharacterized protein n=1 Tax=Oryza glumipatula TaxID=40148 RepID=A0A0E0AEP2_9ORYZ